MMHKTIQYTTLVIVAFAMMTSCTTDPNSPGVEYMPDMYRSPAIEAYVDYLDRNKTALIGAPITVIGEKDDVIFECSLQWNDSYHENVLCFTNNMT